MSSAPAVSATLKSLAMKCDSARRLSSIKTTSIDSISDMPASSLWVVVDMINKIFRIYMLILKILLILSTFTPAMHAQSINELQRGFERPPDDARIMMRWWWFGPAVTKAELEREMRLMKEGGIGGFEVQPVYPLLPDDPNTQFRNLPYLSDEFL